MIKIQKFSYKSDVDIMVYVLYSFWLKDKSSRSKYNTEFLALEARKINTEIHNKFSWTFYPDFPYLDPPRKALFQARTKGFVVGSHAREKNKDGWSITEKGIEYAKGLIISDNQIDSTLKISKDIKEKITKIKNNKNYKYYLEIALRSEEDFLNSKLTIYELAEIVSISFADINYFNEKFHSDYLKLSLWDKEIKVFLDLAIKKFSQYITEEYRLQYMKVRSKSKKDNKRMM